MNKNNLEKMKGINMGYNGEGCERVGNEIKELILEQDECVKKVQGIMENLDSSQLKIEKNAFDVINSSDTSLNLVKKGIVSVEQLLGKIEVLNAAVETSSKNITSMEGLSNMIASFANVIAGISSKTNMLSLNASIEAARAGEQGKGFAVVAGEVRNLAAQSAKSSKEIAETIQSIQNFVGNMVDDMNKIFAVVEEQNGMVSSVGSVLSKILEAAYVSNDVSRKMEHEIAYQRDITDNAREAISTIAILADKASEEINH